MREHFNRAELKSPKLGDEWQRFEAKVGDLMDTKGVVRIKIYDKQGTIIWSDEKNWSASATLIIVN